jgi:hypothetical protein
MQNDVKTKRSQKKQSVPFEDRLGFSPAEFAQRYGKHPAWAYRLIYAGKINVIQNLGQYIIPTSECHRIEATAARYEGKNGGEGTNGESA